jgi:hypothetical protein
MGGAYILVFIRNGAKLAHFFRQMTKMQKMNVMFVLLACVKKL